MKKELLIALVASLIDDALSQYKLTTPMSEGAKGPRGIKGRDGKDFDFEESKDEIHKIISDVILRNIDSIKLKFSDLSDDEKLSLKGKDFNFDSCQEELSSIVTNCIDEKISQFKPKLSDFDQEEILSLKGPRGQRGKQGVQGEKGDKGEDGLSFIYSEHENDIESKISLTVDKIKDSLKFKFEDFTEEQRFLLRGPRGQRGKQGVQGEKGEDGKNFDYFEYEDKITSTLKDAVAEKRDELKLTFSDLSALEKRNLRGLNGRNGKDGKDGRDGKDGLDAPVVEEIKIDEGVNDFSIIFDFSDGSKIETNRIDLPKAKQSFISGGGGGGGGESTPIEIFDDGVSIEKSFKLNFGENLGVTVEDDYLTVDNTKKIKIFDEEGLVSDDLKSITFEGNIEVVNKTTMGDWEYLSDVSSLSGYDNGDTGKIVIKVLSTEEAERLAATRICSEEIPAKRLVTLVSKTHVALAQPDETVSKATVYGISLQSGLLDDTIKILFFGDDTDVSYNFDINQPIYLGIDGTLQTTPYLGIPGFITRVGYGHGEETLMIDIDETIGN